MLEALVCVLWTSVPIICLFVLRCAGILLNRMSLPLIAVVAIIVFQYLGLPILYFQLDDYRAEFVTDRNVILKVWLITSVTTILLSLGASAARLVTGAKIYLNEPADYFQEDRSWSVRRLILLSALSIFVLYIYVSKVGLGNLAIAAVAIQASGEAITLARSQMGNAFDGGYHWYNFFMRDALMFSVLAFFAMREKSAGKVIKTVSVLLFFALVFSLTMAAEKGLFADFILAIMIVFALKNDRGYLRLSHLLRYGLVIFVSLLVFYIAFMGDDDLATAAWSVFSRTTTGSLQPAYHYLQFFPEHEDFLLGRSFPNPGGLLPFTPYPLTVEVMNFVQPEHLAAGVVGTMPTVYWGEVYANFGIPGLAVAPLLLGAWLTIVNAIVVSLKRSPLQLALLAILMVHFKNVSITSFSAYVVDFKLVMLLLVYFFLTVRLRLEGDGMTYPASVPRR